MKHAVTKFRSPKIALKELERFIRDGRHLKSGKPFKKFGDAQPRRLRGPADAMSARICASSAFSVVSWRPCAAEGKRGVTGDEFDESASA